ncbi:MAG: hypothetical protein PHO56_05420 [Patescibacteria group bacterium]|nr:hypothetical protein [Patescibacteria group bacterium]
MRNFFSTVLMVLAFVGLLVLAIFLPKARKILTDILVSFFPASDADY